MNKKDSIKKIREVKDDFDRKLLAIKKRYYLEIKKITQEVNDKKINKLKKELGL